MTKTFTLVASHFVESGLQGKRVLVTGASGGIGSACARAFGEEYDNPEENKNSPSDDHILEDFIAREIDRRSGLSPNSRPQAENSIRNKDNE